MSVFAQLRRKKGPRITKLFQKLWDAKEGGDQNV